MLLPQGQGVGRRSCPYSLGQRQAPGKPVGVPRPEEGASLFVGLWLLEGWRQCPHGHGPEPGRGSAWTWWVRELCTGRDTCCSQTAP